MTEESVATQLGINVELLKEYESGENRVPPQVQLELAETLGVSLSYFYFDNPSKYIHQSEIFHAAGEESAQRTPTSEDKSRMLSAMDNMPPDVRKSLVLIAEVIARKDPKPVP